MKWSDKAQGTFFIDFKGENEIGRLTSGYMKDRMDGDGRAKSEPRDAIDKREENKQLMISMCIKCRWCTCYASQH